jgi:hypothetical protein
LNIEILGVNAILESSGNTNAELRRTLSWLQDTAEQNVWTQWEVAYRDVRILDSQGQLYAVFNLITHDLGRETNRTTLKQYFLAAAKSRDTDADGLPDDWELRYFGNLHAKPGEDPDGDGADNFTEFACGTDPTNPKSYVPIKSGLASKGQQKLLSATFKRRAGAILDYQIETSPDLQQWTPSPAEILLTRPLRNLFDGTGTSEATYSLSQPIAEQPHRFLRIRAAPRQ